MDAEFTKPACPPLTLDEMYAVLERHQKRVVCAPDVYEQVLAAVREARLEGAYQVLECRWLKDGQVVPMASEAEFEALPLALPFPGYGKAPAEEAGA